MEITVDLRKPHKEIQPLPFNGNSQTEHLGLTNHYFTKNGKPWYPVMGEFHFSRFNQWEWARELAKMKSGGVDIVASYVIWIHHEEEKGRWDFSGQRNLRKFIETCQEENLYFYLRIGPWAHGEVRNGGFPDWIQHGNFELRSDNPKYLAAVESYFHHIHEQVEGLFFKDGGPIIGVQIENEYGHAGGFRGEKGRQHMMTLKKMLTDIGFDTPFYTATGWGGGVVIDEEMLPVFGGYVEAPWAQHTDALEANGNFVFSPIFNDPLIASDFQVEGVKFENYEFKIEGYPYLTAELGGGLQVTKMRRPHVTAKDTEVQAMVKLASGANLLGYYMYHGGTNPHGKLSTMEETKDTGSYTDVPTLTYDFQAPLGEFGIIHESYGALRKLHTFIHRFQDILARSQVQFAQPLITDPEDLTSLRYSLRVDPETNSGFAFINNYQRLREMTDKLVNFVIRTDSEVYQFPQLILKNGSVAILPFNLTVGNYTLKCANVSLLTVIDETWIFYGDVPEQAEVIFEKTPPQIIILTTQEADRLLVTKDSAYWSEADLWMENGRLEASSEQEIVTVTDKISGTTKRAVLQTANSKIKYVLVDSSSDQAEYRLLLEQKLTEDTLDILLEMNFAGDRAELYNEAGLLLADWYQIDGTWKVSLKTFDYPAALILKIFAADAPVYYEEPVAEGVELQSIRTRPLVVTDFVF